MTKLVSKQTYDEDDSPPLDDGSPMKVIGLASIDSVDVMSINDEVNNLECDEHLQSERPSER